MSVPGTLYFIRELDGPVKIGWTTKSVERRLHNLQIGNPRKLEIVASISAVPKATEGEWHARYGYCCQRGEWFYALPELLRAINELIPKKAAPEDEAASGAWSTSDFVVHTLLLGGWMMANKVNQTKLAELAGVDRTILNRSLRGVIPMSMATARRLEIATNGAVKASVLLGLEAA